MDNNHSIDFILLWVDGSDLDWQEELFKYSDFEDKKSKVRFREWDNIQYLFRAFEFFTPWVRKIHFVTWGHLPKWLDTSHPKLNIIKHKEYIDSKYLPLFNANPLEINLHHIPGISEHFVYFNDDTFIIKPLIPERFFQDGLPCDSFISNTLSSSSGVGHFVLNNLEILNRHFDKRTSLLSHFSKVFHYRYGAAALVRNIVLLPWPRFTGFVDPHQPQPFLKSTFEEIWSQEKEILEKTSASKFRTCTDVNQYLFRYWQLAQGKFYPIPMKDTAYEEITIENIESGKIEKLIRGTDFSMVCLNDSVEMDDEDKFQRAKYAINSYFENILPNKSSYEK